MLKDGQKGVILQRDKETYAIAPHIPCGLVTPEILETFARVACKYDTAAMKITSAARIAIQKYKGLKYADDNHDAFWLAHLLRLGILPKGYIYPKEERPVRDLLRKRGHLVRLRTSLINSLQDIAYRNCGTKMGANKIKAIKEDKVAP